MKVSTAENFPIYGTTKVELFYWCTEHSSHMVAASYSNYYTQSTLIDSYDLLDNFNAGYFHRLLCTSKCSNLSEFRLYWRVYNIILCCKIVTFKSEDSVCFLFFFISPAVYVHES